MTSKPDEKTAKPSLSARLANGERKKAISEIKDRNQKFRSEARDEFERVCRGDGQ